MNIEDVCKQVLNLSESDAVNYIIAAGFKVRVVERDGQRSVHTREFRPNRINLLVKEGIVFETTLG